MFKQLIVVCLMIAVFIGSACHAASLPAADPAKELSALLKSYNTYSANFTSSTTQAKSLVMTTSTGLVKIKKPGSFYWETKTPNQQIIVSNGESMWIYDVDLQQATEQAAASASQLSPAYILSGNEADLTRYFTITKVLSDTHSHTDSYLLKAKQKEATFTDVTLTFVDGQLTDISVKNSLQQTTDFRFSNIKTNPSLNASLFTFKAPKGVDILKKQ